MRTGAEERPRILCREENNMSEVFQTDFAGREISLKTQYVAGQADGAVLVRYGDTVVLVTVVSLRSKREGVDFLTLTVDYHEITFAAGKIPGGFFKREGRPNEREILTSRIIDRSARPLFPKGYYFEPQIIASVLSVDNENDPDVTAMLGCSAALMISDIPFKGPVAGVRIGRIKGDLICNPSSGMMAESDLDLFLVGRKIPRSDGGFDIHPVMIEGGAKAVEEGVIVEAINVGLASMKPVLELQDRMCLSIGKRKRDLEAIPEDAGIALKVQELATAGLAEAYRIPQKTERYARLDAVREAVLKAVSAEDASGEAAARKALDQLDRKILRDMILNEGIRSDGRSYADIRPISCEVGLLPRTHGSALFTRGETQALAVLTLGTSSDE